MGSAKVGPRIQNNLRPPPKQGQVISKWAMVDELILD